MTSPIDKARVFHSLHRIADPVILYNIWDAGSAAALARAGAKAIATGSWSVAAAQGYADGEALSLEDALAIVARIISSVDLPVSVDFEGGYASDPETVGRNVRKLLEFGVVGLNFEDQVVNGPGLYSTADQVARLGAVRQAVEASGTPAFINARTDIFLKAPPDMDHARLLDEALTRCAAYSQAGADGFFVPGLTDKRLIARICEASSLPVNVMVKGGLASVREMTELGVSRISFGPAPYMALTAALEHEARAVLAGRPPDI